MLEDMLHAVAWIIAIAASVAALRFRGKLRSVRMHSASLDSQISWYKQALHHAGIGAWEWNMRSDEWRWSDRMYSIMGFPSSEPPPKGEAFYGRILETDRDHTHAKEAACLDGRSSLRNEYRFATPDRGVRWVRDAGDVTLDEEGKPTHMLGVTIDVTDEKARLGFLERHAWTDELTGIPNRSALLRHVEEAVALVSEDRIVAVAFIDLNGFKAVNDGLGHEAGDELLRRVAGDLRSAFEPETFVSRLGGDEFVCVSWTSPTDIERDLSDMEARLRCIFSTMTVDGSDLRIGAAVGMAVSRNGSARRLLKEADEAMYAAKATRGHFACCHDATASRPRSSGPSSGTDLMHDLG